MTKYKCIIPILIMLVSCSITGSNDYKAIHNEIFTVDSHCDTPLRLTRGDFDLSERHNALTTGSKYDFPRMFEGGLDASFFAVFVGQGSRDQAGLDKAFTDACNILNTVNQAVQAHANMALIALTPEDGFRLEKNKKLAIFLGIENGYAIGNRLENIDFFYRQGIRYITLVHTRNNDIADSSTDKAGLEHNGLSDFGREVVKRMNRVGMMIDISHASDSAFFQVIRLSEAPVIASHSCARAICDHPRNLSDEMLKALARNGGVIQICILSDYVKKMQQTPQRDSALKAFWAKHANRNSYTDEQRRQATQEWYQLDVDFPPAMATVSDVVDHIDHVVKTVGIDYVGIGTDFDGGGAVTGCFDVSEMPNITAELVKRGYSKSDIRKIWGENLMRVMKQVQQLAAAQ